MYEGSRMKAKSIILFVLCCLAPASCAIARELVLTEKLIGKMKPISFLNYTKGLKKKKITIKYKTPKAAVMAGESLKKARIQKKKEAIAENLAEEIEELKTALEEAKKKILKLEKKVDPAKLKKFAALEAKVAELEKGKKEFEATEITSEIALKEEEKKQKTALKKAQKEEKKLEEEVEEEEEPGGPPPPPPPPPPMDDKKKKPIKKPTKPKKPAVPAPLTQKVIDELTEQQKKASDRLFLKVLRDISQGNHGRKENTFRNHLDFLKEKLYGEVRKNEKFKKRAAFDNLFGKKERDTGTFQKNLKEKIETPAKQNLNTFLDKMYADFTGVRRLLREATTKLSSCVFGANKMVGERDYVVTMLINFIVSLRPEKEKASGSEKDDSDEVAADVLEDLMEKKGRFAGKQRLIEQLAHEFNFLRIKKEFLRFDYLIGDAANSRYKKADFVKKRTLRPLLLLMRYEELDPKDYMLKTFMGMIKKQLFFDPGNFEDVLPVAKWVKKVKIIDGKKKVEEGWDEPKEHKILSGYLETYLKDRGIAAAAAFDILEFLQENSNRLVKNMSSLRSVLTALKQKLKGKKKSLATIETIENMINDMKSVDAIVNQFGVLVDQKKPLSFDVKLRDMLTKDQAEKKLSAPIEEMLTKVKADNKKKFKRDPSFKVGKILYGKLKALEVIKDNKKISEELDKVFTDFFRMPTSVRDFLKKYISKDYYDKLDKESFFLKRIEPYGLLLKALRDIPNFKPKTGKLEDGKYGLLVDVLHSLNEAKLFADAKKHYQFTLNDKEQKVLETGFAYKGRLGEILKSVKSFDLKKLKEQIKFFVALSGVSIQENNVEKKIEETGHYKTIINGVINLIVERVLLGIIDHLKELNKGSVLFKEEEIIDGLGKGKGRPQKKLRKAAFRSFIGLFKELIGIIDKGKNDWHTFKLDKDSDFAKEVERVKIKISTDINALEPGKLAKPDEEKKTIIDLVHKFLDKKLEQLRDIKKSITG